MLYLKYCELNEMDLIIENEKNNMSCINSFLSNLPSSKKDLAIEAKETLNLIKDYNDNVEE